MVGCGEPDPLEIHRRLAQEDYPANLYEDALLCEGPYGTTTSHKYNYN